MTVTKEPDNDGFLQFLEDGEYITALEAEALRSEFRRKKAADKKATLLALVVRKGHFTHEQADKLLNVYNSGATPPSITVPGYQPSRGPVAQAVADESDDIGMNTLAPEADWTDGPTGKPTGGNKRATGPVSRPTTDRKPTAPISGPPKGKATSRRTSRVEDSSPPTTKRGTSNKGVHLSLHEESDGIGSSDKAVAAGTIISGSNMTVAQMREHIGIGDGVKLISSKMESSLAQFQPDAAMDRKRYIVVQEIARGGMGKILEVEDTELRRAVALKVLRKELLGRRDVVERFLEEAQITGQLEHPNIVPVHEMGVDGAGNLYFTMKLVEGLSLSEILLKLREGNRDAMREYPLPKLLDTFIKICEGMAFAHNRGVIHRDLKPANIMVGRFGEVQVMDWGVAKVVGREFTHEHDSGIVVTDRLDSGGMNTVMGSIIGTPSYMAPEQARGDVASMGPETDIFSLGVILYEMLSLRSPWTGKTADEVLEQVREMTPMRPSQRNPEADIPAELERLCLRCLDKEPENRIRTASELANNIRHFIEGRAMGAVQYSAFRLATKWISRHRKEVAGVALMLVLVVGGILGTMWYMRTVEQTQILGLSEDAERVLQAWEGLADERKFGEAELVVDEARQLFQRVLAVDSEDERARAGLEEVQRFSQEIRSRRTEAEIEDRVALLVTGLLDTGNDALNRAAADRLAGDGAYSEAYSSAQAVLALEPGNRSANLMKARAAQGLADTALRLSRFGTCRFWLDQWETTGELKTELESMRRLLQLRSS